MTQNDVVRKSRIAVVIPCYRVTAHILGVISNIRSDVHAIYVVDDCCPEQSGRYVDENCHDSRVKVLKHEENRGVGGAMITGYQQAVTDGATIVVKLDGDGQMDAGMIMRFVQPILNGQGDYTKGNRFYNVEDVRSMPAMRLFGNAVLSFATKLSSGYWTIFDPTNGFTAIHTAVLGQLPLDKISQRYFFESDMLFRLGTIRACVVDVPIPALYGTEISGLRISRILPEFLGNHLRNFCKRIFYNYFLRDFSIASLEFLFGFAMFFFGLFFGIYHWRVSFETGIPASTGTVMVAALPIILGIQLILSFLNFDISATPDRALHTFLDTQGQ